MYGGLVSPRGRIPLTVSGRANLARLASAIVFGAGCVGSIPNAGDQPVAPPGPRGSSGPSATPPAACGGDVTPARIWRLTDEEYQRAVADLLPGVMVPEVSTPGRSSAEFVNVADLYPASGALVADLHSAARTVATEVAADLPA